jgi:hypothetical protein
MRAKRVTLVLVGVGVASALVAAYRANERRFRMLEHEMRSVAEETRQNVAGEVSRRPVVVWSPAPAAAPAAAPAPASTPGAEQQATASTGEAAAAITEAEQAAHVDLVFSQETTDGAWASETERAIGASLRGLTETSTLAALECRRSLCKANLRHPDQTKFSAFLDRVVARADEVWTGPLYSNRDSVGPDGVVQNTIYFAKQGHSIPSPE